MTRPSYEERADELSRLAALLDGAHAGTGGLLLVQGEPGIGKTTLLRRTGALARARGMTVVSARSVQLDRDTSYAAALELCARLRATGVLDEGDVPPAARPLVDGLTPSTVDPFLVRHALTELFVDRAETTPLALLLDDAHWADELSLAWLAHLAARLDDARIAVVLAARGGADADRPALQRLPSTIVPVGPLNPGQVRALVTAALPTVDEAVIEACGRQTRGNPLLLRELVTDVQRRGLTADQVERAVPDGVLRNVVQRVCTLPPATREALEVAAVAGDGTPVRHVAVALGTSVPEARGALDDLVAAGFLVSSPVVDFSHPLVMRAVLDQVPRGRRSALHRRLGELLVDEGVVERAAAHLRETEPAGDRWVVEQLRQHARAELDRGAPAAARAVLERALAEPPGPHDRAEVLAELGYAEHVLGAPTAIDRLREAQRLLGPERVDVVRALAGSLTFDGRVEEAAALLVDARDSAVTAEAAYALEAELLVLGQVEHSLALRTGSALDRAALTSGGGSPQGRMLQAVSSYQSSVVWRGTAAEVSQAVRSAFDGGLAREVGADAPAVALGLMALALTDEPAVTGRVLAEVEQEARRRGSARGIAVVAAIRARTAVVAGDLLGAEADARTSIAVAEATHPALLPFSAACLVLTLTQQGRGTAAEEELARLGMAGRELPPTPMGATLLFARSILRRSRGQIDLALADLDLVRPFGRGRGAWPSSWTPEMVLTLAAAGRTDEAVELASDHVAAARAWGSSAQLAAALRAHAQVTRDSGPLEEALRIVPDWAELLRAQVLADLGAARRRRSRRTEARPLLSTAWEVAHRLRAEPLAERARSELAATGARPRSAPVTGAAALTASERRVAELARLGRTNAAIAQELFVTRKTVEKHLSSAYLKLGIESRAGLDVLDPRADPGEPAGS